MQAGASHFKQPHLEGAAEAVLDGPHPPVGVVPVALEAEHHIHQMLEQAWAGQKAVLGDMAHDHHHAAAGLGEGDQIQGAAAKLAGAARYGIHVGAVHQLDGVDHQHRGLHSAGLFKQSRKVGFAEHPQVCVARGRIAAIQPLGAQSNLMRAFLAAGVQHRDGHDQRKGEHHQGQNRERVDDLHGWGNGGAGGKRAGHVRRWRHPPTRARRSRGACQPSFTSCRVSPQRHHRWGGLRSHTTSPA